MPNDSPPPTTSLARLLGEPLPWRTQDRNPELRTLLDGLQANILKGHGRDHTGNAFLGFAGMRPEAVAAVLRKLAPMVTPSLKQLRDSDAYKHGGASGGQVFCVMLARGAYEKLGTPGDRRPADPAFRAGMRARGQLPKIPFAGIGPLDGLNDPPETGWGAGAWQPGKAEPDAMVLVAADDERGVTAGLEAVERLLGGTGAVVLGVERGEAQRRLNRGGDAKGEGLEHFGYVDGRSQPLFLAEDVRDEAKQHWNPAFPPAQFVVRDPGARSPLACGSYFVFRKLEQNVKLFKEREERLADALGLEGADRERAGALVVGRFEDGTPVVGHCAPQAGPPPNDFNYGADPAGERCPMRGHIRKTNPRGKDADVPPVPGANSERSRIMARRGITYGKRARHGLGDFTDRPERDVGLLFMAYMADIQEQFEFTQAAWANNPNFPEGPDSPRGASGVDAVISQRPDPNAPATWGEGCSGRRGDFDFRVAVTLKGGEYFFAPSLDFLRDPGG